MVKYRIHHYDLHVRLTTEEKLLVDAQADAAGLTLSDHTRQKLGLKLTNRSYAPLIKSWKDNNNDYGN